MYIKISYNMHAEISIRSFLIRIELKTKHEKLSSYNNTVLILYSMFTNFCAYIKLYQMCKYTLILRTIGICIQQSFCIYDSLSNCVYECFGYVRGALFIGVVFFFNMLMLASVEHHTRFLSVKVYIHNVCNY